MKLDQILNTYISQIPRIPSLGDSFTAEQVYDYYRTKAAVQDIDPFIGDRFSLPSKNLQVQEQVDVLHYQRKEFARLGQLLFEAKHKGK